MQTILAANFNTLYKISQKQFAHSFGLHLNSKDWKPYINLGNASFYNFLINGIVKTETRTTIKGTDYDQVLQFDKFKILESPLLLMYLSEVPEDIIAEFISVFLFNTRLRVFCTCPAFKFWGFEYILTKRNSVFGPGESRYPDIRNPELKGVYCKHLWLICESLNTKRLKLAQGLVPFYKRAFGIDTAIKLEKFKKEYTKKDILEIFEDTKHDISMLNNKTVTKAFNEILVEKMININKKKVKTSKETKEKEKKLEPIQKGFNRIYKDYGIQTDEEIDTEGLDIEALGTEEKDVKDEEEDES